MVPGAGKTGSVGGVSRTPTHRGGAQNNGKGAAAAHRWRSHGPYTLRALVEADIARWKRVIGDALRSHTDGRQATEVAIAADALNRRLDLGRPEYVRIA
jgi:hypothetical protein